MAVLANEALEGRLATQVLHFGNATQFVIIAHILNLTN
jgi:hypothetical protein